LKKAICYLAVLASAGILTAYTTIAGTTTQPENLPFKPGERVTYDVSWMGVVGGEGILEVTEKIDYKGRAVFVIEVVGRSIGFVRKLYRVEDHTFSLFDIGNLCSQRMEVKIAEGGYKKIKTIEFDHVRRIATYKVDDDDPEEFEIVPGSLDSFSALYALRAMRGKLRVGESIYIPIFEDRKKYDLEIKVLRKERIRLSQGMVDTLVIKPLLKTEGVFQRRGKMTLWLSDNKSLIPVKVQSKIMIGSFIAKIRDYKGVDINFIPYNKTAGK